MTSRWPPTSCLTPQSGQIPSLKTHAQTQKGGSDRLEKIYLKQWKKAAAFMDRIKDLHVTGPVVWQEKGNIPMQKFISTLYASPVGPWSLLLLRQLTPQAAGTRWFWGWCQRSWWCCEFCRCQWDGRRSQTCCSSGRWWWTGRSWFAPWDKTQKWDSDFLDVHSGISWCWITLQLNWHNTVLPVKCYFLHHSFEIHFRFDVLLHSVYVRVFQLT